MTKEDMAALLNGREMGDEITDAEEVMALESRLFVIFGYSDDNVEIRGVDREEVGMYGGGTFRLGPAQVLKDWDEIDTEDKAECRRFFETENVGKEIEAVWCEVDGICCDGICWTFKTEVPHATFDVMEDGEVWCRGIVISAEDLK